jgi:hypothetical protein
MSVLLVALLELLVSVEAVAPVVLEELLVAPIVELLLWSLVVLRVESDANEGSDVVVWLVEPGELVDPAAELVEPLALSEPLVLSEPVLLVLEDG